MEHDPTSTYSHGRQAVCVSCGGVRKAICRKMCAEETWTDSHERHTVHLWSSQMWEEVPARRISWFVCLFSQILFCMTSLVMCWQIFIFSHMSWFFLMAAAFLCIRERTIERKSLWSLSSRAISWLLASCDLRLCWTLKKVELPCNYHALAWSEFVYFS